MIDQIYYGILLKQKEIIIKYKLNIIKDLLV